MRINNKITVGENLKRIRKDLGLKQHEIVGEEVTRNLISLIENNKATLYDTVANIIAKNINKIMQERDIEIFIQGEDLLNPDRYDARKVANEYIERLENALLKKEYNICPEELNKIESFLNKWNFIDKKVRIYELLGDIFYVSNNLNKEYYYYFKALEASYSYPNLKTRFKLAIKLCSNCIITGKYEEAINLCRYMLLNHNDIPDKVKGKFHYNIALSYRKLNQIDKCLNELENAKAYLAYIEKKDIKKILMLESACYSKIGNLNKALNCFNNILKILNENDNIDEICATYINMIQIYIKQNDTENITKYFDKIMIILPYIDENSYYLPEIFFQISNIYSHLKRYDDSEKYLLTALSLAKKNENHFLLKKFRAKQVKLYIDANWLDKLEGLLSSMKEQLDALNLNPDFSLVLKILLYYIKQNKSDMAESLILDLLRKEKEV